MLCVQVCLGAVRAGKLSVSILRGDHSVLGGSGAGSTDGRSSGSTWQDSSAALRTYDVCRRVIFLRQWLLAVGRRHAGRHLSVMDTVLQWRRRSHRSQRHQPVRSGCRCNWLRVRHGRRRLRHHGRRSLVWLNCLLLVRIGMQLVSPRGRLPAHLLLLVSSIAHGARCIRSRCRGGMRRGHRLAVHRVHRHGSMLRLQGRQGMRRLRTIVLQLLRSYRRERGIGGACRDVVAAIVVHDEVVCC